MFKPGNKGIDDKGNKTTSTPNDIPSITYDPITQMTKSITVSGSPTKTMSFNYSADNERVLKIESDGTTKNSNLYIRGNNEYPVTEKANLNNTLTDKIYIYGPTGLIAFNEGTATLKVDRFRRIHRSKTPAESSDSDEILRTGKSIRLKPEFSASNGSNFAAKMGTAQDV